MNKTVTFLGFKCNVEVKRFGNNRPALVLTDAEDGSPVARVSVNLPEVEMADNETGIKNWSENEGLLEILVEGGVVSEPNRYAESGHVRVPICTILIE